MKIRIKISALCAAFAITILLTACGGGDDFLVGRWEIVEVISGLHGRATALPKPIQEIERISRGYELYNDFTGVFFVDNLVDGTPETIQGTPFTWSRNDGYLTITGTNNYVVYSYEYYDQTLRLSRRISGSTPGSRTTETTVLQRVTDLE